MSRRTKPCEWCEEEQDVEIAEGRNGFYMWASVYPVIRNQIIVTVQCNDENGELMETEAIIPMNYCPNCGRRLI